MLNAVVGAAPTLRVSFERFIEVMDKSSPKLSQQFRDLVSELEYDIRNQQNAQVTVVGKDVKVKSKPIVSKALAKGADEFAAKLMRDNSAKLKTLKMLEIIFRNIAASKRFSKAAAYWSGN